MTAIIGGCLCGAVTVAVDAVAGPLMFCHCRECRKSAGAPFLAVLPVPCSAFRLHDPTQRLTAFRVTPHKARYFCSACGSPVYSQRDGADTVRVRAGVLEMPADIALGGHIYCADAAAWDDIQDSLPRHAGIEPGRAPIISQEESSP
jgi:hypothetical protein